MVDNTDLLKFAKKELKGKKFVVVIQREPYIHTHTADGIKLEMAAGGAHLLLDGILKQVGGLMVALGAGNADSEMVDNHNCLKVPPQHPAYTLKRVFLKKKEIDGWYYGFANQTLWPLSHVVFVKPTFSAAWWNEYVNVNKQFAAALLEEVGPEEEAVVWINDYHLTLLPQLLKASRPKLRIGTFWHIPWATYEIFRICPWRKEILEGLLGSDFIGFHRGYHVDNFIDCCRRELGVIVDSEPRSVSVNGHTTKLANLPAGIDYHEIKDILERHKNTDKKLVKRDFGIDSKYLAIGVDRIDYTKGIPERLKIIDRFLEKYPDFIEKFSYLAIGAPSRIHIPAYKVLNREIADLVEKINWKYSTNTWQPIYQINEVIPREKVLTYYSLADVCMVTSLDDGMNLVAKEYIISAPREKGSLLLSKFTGAAKDLKSAFLINPYDTENSVDMLYKSLTISKEERIKRMSEMKEVVRANNIYEWGIEFIKNTISS